MALGETRRVAAAVAVLIAGAVGAVPTVASPADLVLWWVSMREWGQPPASSVEIPQGGTATMEAMIANVDSAPDSPPAADSTVGFYLSADATITPSDILIASAQIPPLFPGDSFPVRLDQVALDPSITGQYYIGAIADVYNTVAETNETNNALAGNLVQIGPDHSPPIITVSGVTDGMVTSTLPLTICYVAEDATLARAQGTLDGVTFYGCTSVYFTGLHDLTVTASDRYGNTATTQLSFTIADGPLAVVPVSPVEGAVFRGSPIDLLVAVSSDYGVSSVETNGTALVEQSTGYYLGAAMPLSEGPNAFHIAAHDVVGNVAEAVLNVVSDTIPPLLTVTSPADGALVGWNVTVDGTVSDSTPVTVRVSWPMGPPPTPFRPGGLPVSASPTGQFATNIPVDPGTTTISITATDAAGNVSPTVVRHVTSCPTDMACGGSSACRCSASFACVFDPGITTFCYDGNGNMTGRLVHASGDPCVIQTCP